MSREIEFTVGSGNVFADLGHPNPEEALLKAKLVREISVAIEEGRFTPSEAATALDCDEQTLRAITRGQLSEFGVEYLLRCLTALERDVTITIGPKKQERGRIELISAT